MRLCHLQIEFHSSFPIWMPCVSFSCLTALTATQVHMLSGSGKRRYPCLGPDLTGKALRFSPLSVRLAVGFLEIPLS